MLEETLQPYPVFLTIPEVSEVLRIDVPAVRVRLREGTLPGYQPTGRHWIVDKRELIQYLRGTRNSCPQVGASTTPDGLDHD